jgi:hypothetical protein
MNLSQNQKKALAKLTNEQQLVYNMMMFDTNLISSVPTIPTPQWVTDLGHDVKRLISEGVIKRVWFDEEGHIKVDV